MDHWWPTAVLCWTSTVAPVGFSWQCLGNFLQDNKKHPKSKCVLCIWMINTWKLITEITWATLWFLQICPAIYAENLLSKRQKASEERDDCWVGVSLGGGLGFLISLLWRIVLAVSVQWRLLVLPLLWDVEVINVGGNFGASAGHVKFMRYYHILSQDKTDSSNGFN